MLLSRLVNHQDYDVPFFLLFSINYVGLGLMPGFT